MSNSTFSRDPFIQQAVALIEENLADEKFGVSELAEAMSMSRSNLLRKIKKQTGGSASQFIRQVRLQKGMEMLRESTMTVSEVSYAVGFGSTSYFIKCFREHYGYPPGEAAKMEIEAEVAEPLQEVLEPDSPVKPRRRIFVPVTLLLLLLIAVVFVFYDRSTPAPPLESELEKSIAVLPFRNESSDSTNVYFINGLMESTLGNLQKIQDVRVVSRTSSEAYGHTNRSIPEIARELNVNYVVEGSGQRVGDQVLLSIQLIEAANDRPVWSEQYRREVVDVFELQNEVARKIAAAVEAVVTPSELEQIEKKPTENLVAYDYYLQALDNFHAGNREGLERGIPLFERAVEEDPEFALAYAYLSISYYLLDMDQKEKSHAERINGYADKALLYDPKSAESLLAKAFYYIHTEEYRLAVPHLEKALEYNPNSSAVVQTLADVYARVIPNTSKYLEYALKGAQLDIAANDSVARSYIYLHLANALVQTGFVDEAMTYIDKSLEYNPENYYSPLVRIYILFARDGDLDQTRKLLFREWKKDTTRLDILQEVAKVHYYQENYDSAYHYYEKFVWARDTYGLGIYPQEDIKIAYTYKKKGLESEAERFYKSYAAFCEEDESIYKSMSTAIQYVYEGKREQAIEQLRAFTTQDNYQYWVLLFLKEDPLIKPLEDHPEFKGIIKQIEDRFWDDHAKLKELLEEKDLL